MPQSSEKLAAEIV